MQKQFPLAWVLIVLGILFYAGYYAQQKKEFALAQREKGYVFVKVVPIQTALGWGYEVQVDGKPFMHQEFIPAIAGRRGFETKEDALLVGNKVVEKLNANLPPAIHITDLKALGIPIKASDTVLGKKLK